MFFFKNRAENDAGKLFQDIFSIFKKALCKVKTSDLQAAWFHYISIALKLGYNKNKLDKTLDFYPEIYSILIFEKRVWE